MDFLKNLKNRSMSKRKRNDQNEKEELVEKEQESEQPKKKKLKSEDSNLLSRFFKSVKNRFSNLFKETSRSRRRRIFGTPAATGRKNKTYIITPLKPLSPKSCVSEWRQKHFYVLNENLAVTEKKNIEFKTGGGNYPIQILPEHVRKYGSAFLNSEGGVLLAGVLDNGVVRGINASWKTRQLISANIIGEFSRFIPRVPPSMYTINFVPVAYPQSSRIMWQNQFLTDVYVLELCVKRGAETEIYEDGRHNVFVRREASVEGPLNPIRIKDLVIQKHITALQLSQKRNEDEGDCEDSIICLGTIEPN